MFRMYYQVHLFFSKITENSLIAKLFTTKYKFVKIIFITVFFESMIYIINLVWLLFYLCFKNVNNSAFKLIFRVKNLLNKTET